MKISKPVTDCDVTTNLMTSSVEARSCRLTESCVYNSPVEGTTLIREESEVVVSITKIAGLTESEDKFSCKKISEITELKTIFKFLLFLRYGMLTCPTKVLIDASSFRKKTFGLFVEQSLNFNGGVDSL